MEGQEPTGTSYAKKFELLLDAFPHPERRHLKDPKRRRWKMVEIDEATGGRVSSAYLSALRSNKIVQPGLEPLKLIARAMDFPFDLWLLEPEQWEPHLKGRRPRPIRSIPNGRRLTEKVNRLFDSIPNRKTGKTFTNREVASLSGGRLTEEEVAALRDGTLTDPSRNQLLALCDVFDVDFSYWSGSDQPERAVNREILEALQDKRIAGVLQKTRDLSDEQLDMLALMAEQLDRYESGRRRAREVDERE